MHLLIQLGELFLDQTSKSDWGYRRADLEKPHSISPSRFVAPEARGASSVSVHLPAALIDWYAAVGRLPALTAVQNSLLRPDELQVVQGHVVFYVECQGCTYFGIRIDDLGQADPPVYYRHSHEADWHKQDESLSSFSITVALTELCVAGAVCLEVGELTDLGISTLRKNTMALPVTQLSFFAPEMDARFLVGASFLAHLHAGSGLIYVAGLKRTDFRAQVAAMVHPGSIEWHDRDCA